MKFKTLKSRLETRLETYNLIYGRLRLIYWTPIFKKQSSRPMMMRKEVIANRARRASVSLMMTPNQLP